MLMSSIRTGRHVRRRRRDAFLHQPLAGEGVDEGALSGVELADDDEEEQLVELLDRSLERGHVLVACAEANQAGAQLIEDAPLLADDVLLSRIDKPLQ